MAACEAKICEKGGSGNLLPLFGDGEQDWPRGVRVVLYFCGLLWTFMGVAIVADVFMGAIERITSKKIRKIIDPSTGRQVTMKVWNDTVANLTLMALGSSAPEILLSVIELVTGRMYSGELGPSTIVGSAAFNLLCISAVCVLAIPGDEVRYIKDIHVFIVTASFSVFAYAWLYLIVGVISEDVIHIWEAAVTFFLFPVLVSLAWYADRGGFSSSDVRDEVQHSRRTLEGISKDELAQLQAKIHTKHGDDNLTDQELARLIGKEHVASKSRAAYRVEVTRKAVAGRRVAATTVGAPATSPTVVVPFTETIDFKSADVVIEFNAESYAVVESVGTLNVFVKRTGYMEACAQVDYHTRDGTAKASEDYEPTCGTLQFQKGEAEKVIPINIVDDTKFEEDEDFFVHLKNARCHDVNYSCGLGRVEQTRIAIIDDDEPGILSFFDAKEHRVIEEMKVAEHAGNEKIVPVTVRRRHGSAGKIACKYMTEDATATKGKDYSATSGVLEMADGQTSATIEFSILPRGRYNLTEEFRIILYEPSGGVRFDESTDGGEDTCILTVIIEADDHNRGRVDRVMDVLQGDWDKAQLGHANWKDQFRYAFLVNGGEEEDPSALDWVMHVITIFWKVLFAVIPPTDFCDGWACFFVALMMIGLVTAIIGDLASLLGCVLSIPASITAITFVALGTSLPDTFASKTAAVQDPYADASIGNITGSNSVNVFLGLGLPWLIGSIYWRTQELTSSNGIEWAAKYPDVVGRLEGHVRFVVKGGDLGFGVVVFSICAIACISVFVFRRRAFGGELGGPLVPKIGTAVFFVSLWFCYIGLSIWKILDNKGPCD